MKLFILFLLLGTLTIGCASKSDVDHPSGLKVEEINPDKWTALTKQNLLHLAQVYDLRPFLFSKNIRIQTKVIPESHPVITLNTRNAERPQKLLANFLHEELHWWTSMNPVAVEGAINELKKIYPKAPKTLSYGQDGTYLHLIICFLEYRALQYYLGKKEAREIITSLMKKDKVYPWIYYQVLNKDYAIRKIVLKHKLLPPPLPQNPT